MRTLLVIALLAAACGGSSKSTATPAPAASSKKMTFEEALAATKTMFADLGGVFQTHGTDCPALAAGIRGWTEENRATMARLDASDQPLTPEQQQRGQQEMEAVFNDLLAVMAPAMEACGGDAEVKAAIDEIPMGRKR